MKDDQKLSTNLQYYFNKYMFRVKIRLFIF